MTTTEQTTTNPMATVLTAVNTSVAWLDEHNGRTTTELTSRILKIGEEFGEAAQAWIGHTGQNPRKGVTHTVGDVTGELADVVLSSLVAIASLGADPATVLTDKATRVISRIDEPDTTGSHDGSQESTDELAKLTADVVLIAPRAGEPHVLLIQRRWPPFEGRLALPGGHLNVGEDTLDAAVRELAEETGIHLTGEHLAPVKTYTEVGRDPRARYATTAYVAELDHPITPTAGDDASDAQWVLISTILDDPDTIAFDHHRIITDALDRLTDQAGQEADCG